MTDKNLLEAANKSYDRIIDSYFHFDESESQAIVRYAISLAEQHADAEVKRELESLRDMSMDEACDRIIDRLEKL